MPVNWKDRARRLAAVGPINSDGVTLEKVIDQDDVGQSVPIEPTSKPMVPVDLAYAINPGALIAVTSSGTRLFDLNRRRIYASVVNVDASNPVYIRLGPGAFSSAKGIYLAPSGGSFEFGLSTDCPFTGEVWAYSASSINVVVTEL